MHSFNEWLDDGFEMTIEDMSRSQVPGKIFAFFNSKLSKTTTRVRASAFLAARYMLRLSFSNDSPLDSKNESSGHALHLLLYYHNQLCS